MPKKKATTKVTKTKTTPKPADDAVFGVVTYRMTYLWSDTSTFSTIKKIVVQGTVVKLLDVLPDNWSKVVTVEENPVEGYIRSSFVGRAEG